MDLIKREIGLLISNQPWASRLSDFEITQPDYSLNCTPLSPIIVFITLSVSILVGNEIISCFIDVMLLTFSIQITFEIYLSLELIRVF